ncbi:MAG TPA: hypothetical protein VNH83_22935 [Bryobacteraceae bacterium]|nr:hypothetical protein [Bryobacteraceae bacterium]
MSFEDSSTSIETEQVADAVPAPANGPNPQRLHERLSVNSQLHISWRQDERSAQRSVRARAIDVSKFGVLLEAESPIPSGTVVSVQSSNFTMIGRASVRHCVPKGLNYRIGLFMPDRLTRGM